MVSPSHSVHVNLASFQDTPFQTTNIVAAVVCRTEEGNLHAGLLFRNGDSVAELHLGWEDYLSDRWRWAGVWASPEAPTEKLVAAAGMCRLIWRRFQRDKKFPYALRFDGTTFDASGRLVLGSKSRGLTCATLILAVMDFAEIRILEEDSWPVRRSEDQAFLEFVRPFAAPSHLKILEQEVEAGVRRIWPDEVVGACACELLPVEFETARAAADKVLEHLAP